MDFNVIKSSKLTIEDIKKACIANDISCENCANWQYKETLGTEIGICFKGGYTLEGRQTIRLEAKHHFCNSFNQKDKWNITDSGKQVNLSIE